MPKMSAINQQIMEGVLDGLDIYEIAEVLANEYNLNPAFTFKLVTELLDQYGE